jgi:hypothetical protein
VEAIKGRLAKPEELEFLQSRLLESGFPVCDLKTTPCVVTEAGGELTGMLPIKLITEPVAIWQAEPMLIWTDVPMTRRRSMYLLWKTAERWIAGPLNESGVRRYLAITYLERAQQLFDHAGIQRLDAALVRAFQHLSTDKNAVFYFRQL